MRIAYFINQYPKVSHSFIRREIKELERQGFEVQRYALRGWDATLVDQEDIDEQEITRYVLKGGLFRLFFYGARIFLTSPIKFLKTLVLAAKLGFRSNKSIAYYVVYFLESCVLIAWMRESKCEHVHAHFGTNSSQVTMFASLLADVNYSFTVHGPEEFDMPRFLRMREKVKHSKFVVAISSYGRSQLFRHINIEDWPKVHVVHCGIETSFYENKSDPASDTNRLVCVGRLCEQKGQLLLIHALHQLKEEDISVDLVLAGDGEMREDIERLVAEFDLTDNVRITGWISADQVREELLKSRAMVLPSFAEGLPVVIMEAFALRRPVLSTYVAGIPELIIDGENGWLIPAGSVESLKEALRRCLVTPVEALNEMGEAAHERVLSRHSIENEAKKLASLIRS